MALAQMVPGPPMAVVQHVYRVDQSPTSRPQRHYPHSHPSRRQRRPPLISHHLPTSKQHVYLTSTFIKQASINNITNEQSPPATPTSPASPRSCVHSFSNMPIVESVHNHEAALPGSPPDLTESKSSKSSGSFRSSCLTDATGPENLSHFEDIALADSGRSSVDLHHHHNNSHHQHVERKSMNPSQRRQTGPVYSRQNGMHSADALRDSTNLPRQRYPSLKGHVNMAAREQPRSRHDGRPMRRGFTSPSAVSIGTMSISVRDHSSSRSPSPMGRLSSNGSQSPRSIGSRTNSFTSNHRSFNRKSSQPRKTIEELEAEYHDSDEDVPEDAVIWNVPISPRPPIASSQPPSPKRSTSQANLPERPSHHSSQPNLHPTEIPPSPMRPEMPHSATISAFPPDVMSLGPKGRTKSWTNDLSDEARELTAALEAHAEAEREQSQERRSSSTGPARPVLNDKMRSKTTVIELPPLQKGNIMIDPLPISKEKEAVLSRTRPSWLPPKSQKEEKKHLREWERMMAKAAEAEKRREEKDVEEKKAKKDITYNIARVWEEYVIPNWDNVIRAPRTRELWWRGITPRCRGTVWNKAIGNELALTETSYNAALGRAKTLRASIEDLPTEEQQKHKDAAWLSAIARDVPTVLPELGIFGKDAPLHDTLMDVLLAYAAYRSDVGYVYGTHTLAGLLVLNLPAWEAFVTLANLLNRPMALAYLVNDHSGIRRAQALVLATLKYKIPKLHAHLVDEKTGLDPEEWLSPFLMTMGTMHLSTDACSRLWDVVAFEADKSLIRAVVGVLSLLESKLYGDREEILSLLGWGAAKWDFGEDDLIKAVREAGKVSGPQPQPQVHVP